MSTLNNCLKWRLVYSAALEVGTGKRAVRFLVKLSQCLKGADREVGSLVEGMPAFLPQGVGQSILLLGVWLSGVEEGKPSCVSWEIFNVLRGFSFL